MQKTTAMAKAPVERAVALDVTRREIASRIKHVCEHFSDAEFAALVAQMAEIEVRYRMRAEWLGFHELLRPAPPVTAA